MKKKSATHRKVRDKDSEKVVTEEIINRIQNAMRIGAFMETAAALAGVSKRTFYKWLKAGARTKKGLEWKLVNAIEVASAEYEVRDLQNVDKCAMGQDWEYERYPEDVIDPETGHKIHRKGSLVLNSRGNPIPLKLGIPPDWRASAWRLSRKFPQRWGDHVPPVVEEHFTPDGKPEKKVIIYETEWGTPPVAPKSDDDGTGKA